MNDLIFYQMFESSSSTYTYLLGDAISKEAVIIDPVLETVARDNQLIQDLGLKLKFIIDTHIHADHITGADALRRLTGAKNCLSKTANVSCADVLLAEGSLISFGPYQMKVLSTPGHTDSCLSFLMEDRIFTGDALLVRGNGRTDFQQGSSAKLFESLQKLFRLDENIQVYPAHDYSGHTKTTIGLEKKFNPRVAGKTLPEFEKIMNELKLAEPKKIQIAVPANLVCGRVNDAEGSKK